MTVDDEEKSGGGRFCVGRYVIYEPFAKGGMATLHLARLLGVRGFSRAVAAKRLHPAFAKDPEFVAMLRDEARIGARVRSVNILPVLDVLATGGELILVMEYGHGESLAKLMRDARERGAPIDLATVSRIVVDVLSGLHAAHETSDEKGAPLGIVHRDVSPDNVLVGVDGLARVLDFGIAKAKGRLASTRTGQMKGKLAYMAAEQIRGGEIDRRTDVYAVGVLLWELLTNRPLFSAETESALVDQVLLGMVKPPSRFVRGLPPALDDVIRSALASAPELRFATAKDFARALEAAIPAASSNEVARWVQEVAGEALATRADLVRAVESDESFTVSASQSRIHAAVEPSPAPSTEEESSAPHRREAEVPQARRLGVRAAAWILATVSIAGAAAVGSSSLRSRRDTDSRATPALPRLAPAIEASSAVAIDAGTSKGVQATDESKTSPRTPHPKAIRLRPSSDPCAIPFTVDSAGNKNYKRECL